MRRVRVTAEMKKLLDNSKSQPSRGVFVVPKILPVDEWERIAMAHQERLAREVRE
jgi:hypothetical protein